MSWNHFNCQLNSILFIFFYNCSTWRKCTCVSRAVNYSRLEQFNEISVYLVSRSVSGSNKGRSAETVSLSVLLTRLWIFSSCFLFLVRLCLSVCLSAGLFKRTKWQNDKISAKKVTCIEWHESFRVIAESVDFFWIFFFSILFYKPGGCFCDSPSEVSKPFLLSV